MNLRKTLILRDLVKNGAKKRTAIAEQESRSISENIKWAYQKKFERGSVVLNTSQLLGYRKAGTDEEGNAIYEIVEEEAQIIRRIYGDYVAGKTIHQIAKDLEADGILTKTGKTSGTPGPS